MMAINNRDKYKKIVSDVFFFVALGIFLCSEILCTTFFGRYLTTEQIRAIRYFWLILLFLREFCIPGEYNFIRLVQLLIHNLKWLVCAVLIVALVVATKFITDNNLVFFIAIFLFCARNIDLKKIAMVSFWVILITVAFVVISSYLGIVDDYIKVLSWRTRHYQGFIHPLYVPTYLLELTAIYLYIRKDRIMWFELAILLLVNILEYLQAVSRIPFIFSVLAILLAAFFKIKPRFLSGEHKFFRIFVFAVPICFTVTLIFALNYDSSIPVFKWLNSLLERRIYLAHNSIIENGIHLFGQKLSMVGYGLSVFGELSSGVYNYVDSYYIQFLIRNGIVPTFIWISLSTLTMYYLYRTQNYFLLMILSIYALCWVVDDLSGRLYFNIFWLAGSWILTRFMNQHCQSPQLIPSDDSRAAYIVNRIFSWKCQSVKETEN